MLPDPVRPTPDEFTPHLRKCVLTKSDITMFMTDVFTGKGTTKPSPDRGQVVVTRLKGESDMALYKRATDEAVAVVTSLRK